MSNVCCEWEVTFVHIHAVGTKVSIECIESSSLSRFSGSIRWKTVLIYFAQVCDSTNYRLHVKL